MVQQCCRAHGTSVIQRQPVVHVRVTANHNGMFKLQHVRVRQAVMRPRQQAEEGRVAQRVVAASGVGAQRMWRRVRQHVGSNGMQRVARQQASARR